MDPKLTAMAADRYDDVVVGVKLAHYSGHDWTPARVIQREELGHLGEGAEADVTVLRLREGDFGFWDVQDFRMDGGRKLEAELTLRAGRVVWDVNGISKTDWSE